MRLHVTCAREKHSYEIGMCDQECALHAGALKKRCTCLNETKIDVKAIWLECSELEIKSHLLLLSVGVITAAPKEARDETPLPFSCFYSVTHCFPIFRFPYSSVHMPEIYSSCTCPTHMHSLTIPSFIFLSIQTTPLMKKRHSILWNSVFAP